MTKLFTQGGPIYMGTITILLLIIIVVAVSGTLSASKGNQKSISDKTFKLVNELGLLALMVGIISMTISLLGAFSAMEQAGSISTAVLAGGLRVTMIPVLYGLIIFTISKFIRLGMISMMKKSEG